MFLVYTLEVVVTWNIQLYLILELFWNNLMAITFGSKCKMLGMLQKNRSCKKDHRKKRIINFGEMLTS